jgi:hypothetical protein
VPSLTPIAFAIVGGVVPYILVSRTGHLGDSELYQLASSSGWTNDWPHAGLPFVSVVDSKPSLSNTNHKLACYGQ